MCLCTFQFKMLLYTRDDQDQVSNHWAKQATIHQLTTMLSTSKNVLFPPRSILEVDSMVVSWWIVRVFLHCEHFMTLTWLWWLYWWCVFQFEILLCVQDDQDPAINLVKKLQDRYPKVDCKLFIGMSSVDVQNAMFISEIFSRLVSVCLGADYCIALPLSLVSDLAITSCGKN